jgi:polyferredoxin
LTPEAQTGRARGGRSRPYATWITARKLIQYILLIAFLALMLAPRQGGWPATLVNLPIRLDPLTILAHLLSSRIFLASSAIVLIVVILTLVFGRAWCGWVCPLGTVLDLFTPKRRKGKLAQSNLPDRLRSIKYGLLLVILMAALLGNLTLLIFDPLTILIRTLTTSILPAMDQAITVFEGTLYRIPFLAGPVSTFDGFIRPGILPLEALYYRQALLYAFVFCLIVGLNWVAPRFWCRYLCPLGGLLGLMSKLALVRRQVREDCKGCAICRGVCPTGTIDPKRGYASDPSECTMCLDCMDACPRNSIDFVPALIPASLQEYDPNRRQALATFATTAVALAIFRSEALVKHDHPFNLQPPGARENDLVGKCVRCGECMRTCPTNALQPALRESGIEGLWTPVLIPRLGYCDYACNACGQVCPVQAIPPLTLNEKREQVLGKAYINQNRCIAWADHTDCIVCEEMCPLPEKAIHLQPTRFTLPDQEPVEVQLPFVDREVCIGCGICEYKCPVNGEAAIRVYVPPTIG